MGVYIMKVYKIVIYILLLLYVILIIDLHSNYYRENAIKIPVITFHRLVLNEVKNTKYKDNQWVGSIDVFEEMMIYLHNNGYNTISTKEFIDWYDKKIELPKKSILITFDDGFYEDYYLAYPILKKYNLKATSFIVGSRIKDKTPEFDSTGSTKGYIGNDVIELVRNEYPNWEFQSHSYNLHKYDKNGLHRIRNINKEKIYEDVKKTKELGFNVMAYPFGDYNELIVEALKDNDFKVAFGFWYKDYARRTDDRYNIHRIKINGKSDITYLKNWLKYL